VASVHDGDWPYERAPLAADCRDGWRQIARACHRSGALLLAGLGHTGLQGSSAYSQRELWGPSGFTDVASRETPMIMEQPQVDAIISGFAVAAAAAVAAGADGVEIDAGAGALLRQFHSGLTNQRTDAYGPGADRLRADGCGPTASGAGQLALTLAVLSAVRAAIGCDHVLALRLCCDELAPWAGITPEVGAEQAAALAPSLDLLTVVRGGTLRRQRLPARRSHPAPVQRRPGRRGPNGRPRSGAGRAAGQRGRRGGRSGRAGRRPRRPGGDDPGPDRRRGAGGQAAGRLPGANPPVHPVQPGVPGSRLS
jgi:2,4-dienoyl-CoA reductase-like NADH-dependent reductase (Old Yellow Enzyme family)